MMIYKEITYSNYELLFRENMSKVSLIVLSPETPYPDSTKK